MRKIGSKYLMTFAVGLTLALGLGEMTSAHDGHDHGGATYGGAEAKTKRHHFEVVFSKVGVKPYAHGPDHKAVDVSRAKATATFYHPSAPEKPWFERELRPAPASPGQSPASLDLAMDLGTVPASGVKVAFQVTGLADPADPTAQFTVPLAVINSGEIMVTKATQADQAVIKVRKLCKVSNEELGSMGVPLKVMRGNKSILICGQGCVKTIKADPDKYFGAQTSAVPAAGAGHEHHNH
jgi:hypothetical protein